MITSKTLAIDCDGVLLDYALAYACAWERAFGYRPKLKNAHAYYPMDRWGVPQLAGEDLERFRATFDQNFWSTIPPMAGALEACQQLVEAGFALVCVTALDQHNLAARKKNLSALGFPIEEVIATPHQSTSRSPKAHALEQLKPIAFVDDFAPYLTGVDARIHKALIVRDPEGSPNIGEALHLADSTHADLLSFANWWVTEHAQN